MKRKEKLKNCKKEKLHFADALTLRPRLVVSRPQVYMLVSPDPWIDNDASIGDGLNIGTDR